MSLVEYEKKNHLVTITMNRPDKLNAINPDMLMALGKHGYYRDDEDAAIFTGAENLFFQEPTKFGSEIIRARTPEFF
jgi:enoyl-CoA hydratase/carnithine racemase